MKEAKKINDVSEDKLIEYTDTMVRIKSINQLHYLILVDWAKNTKSLIINDLPNL